MTRIGFAGLGIMGSRMARNLLAKGHSLTVWNRSPGAAESLVGAGAHLAATPSEMARASEVVFTCLADPPAVESVYCGDNGILAGISASARCVDTSTISPALARSLSARCREHGAELLEAPVTGSKRGAQDGTLLLMTSGRRAVHDELEPLLLVIGKRAIYVGEAGAASTVKLIGNALISFMLEALAEGLTLGRAAGLRPEQILEVVQASGFASPYWAVKGSAMIARTFETQFSLDLLHKDQGLALALGAEHKIPMPGLAALHEVVSSARAQGLGGEDIAAVVKAIERMAGRQIG
jgi:3-hydroxyisobutyrate dehydrogenase-like beta-hydroxyacid dehydrogenase